MKTIKKISALVLAVVLTVSLTACGNNTSTGVMQWLALLIGYHGNSYAPDLTNPILTGEMTNVTETYGQLLVVGVDGKPQAFPKVSLDIKDEYKQANPTKLHNDAVIKANSLLSQLSQVTADDPEVDTLAALILAANSLADAPAGVKKVICVLDTGFSTTGLLDFRNNLLYADPESIVEDLKKEKAIPNLDNTDVYFFNLGQVAPPQQPLSYAQQDKLESIWTAIVEAGGGSAIISKTPGTSEVLGEGLPSVSPVEVEAVTPVTFDMSALEPVVEFVEADEAVLDVEEDEPVAFREPTVLSEEQIQFIPDSDEYLEPEKAAEILNPIADYMISNPSLRLLLVGSTAGEGVNDFTLWLSQARADAVKSSLVQRGVGEERLETLGLGAQDPWHISCPLDSEMSALNRKVVLIDIRTEAAQGLLSP